MASLSESFLFFLFFSSVLLGCSVLPWSLSAKAWLLGKIELLGCTAWCLQVVRVPGDFSFVFFYPFRFSCGCSVEELWLTCIFDLGTGLAGGEIIYWIGFGLCFQTLLLCLSSLSLCCSSSLGLRLQYEFSSALFVLLSFFSASVVSLLLWLLGLYDMCAAFFVLILSLSLHLCVCLWLVRSCQCNVISLAGGSQRG